MLHETIRPEFIDELVASFDPKNDDERIACTRTMLVLFVQLSSDRHEEWSPDEFVSALCEDTQGKMNELLNEEALDAAKAMGTGRSLGETIFGIINNNNN